MAVPVVPAAPQLAVLPTPSTSKDVGGATASTVVAVTYDRASQADVRQCARIAAVTFEEVARNLFAYGATPEAIAFRAVYFDQHLAGSLAYRQGKRTRPQDFYVARDRDTGRVLGFVTWTVQGGPEVEREYQLTDNEQPDGHVPFPDVPNPPGMQLSVRQSFIKNSVACQDAYMGDRKRCYIKYLCVDPNVQRTGAGRALIHLVRRKNPGLPLYLEAATTPSAEKFYFKLGFQQLGEMMFERALKPLPCMSLEPETVSLVDEPSVIAAVKMMPPL